MRPFLFASLLLSIASAAEPRDAAPAPLRIEGPETKQLDLSRPDGGLLPVRGAQNFGVFRASRTKPELADGKGYAYHHHPDLAVWKGRFYLGWGSGQKDEDTWPARELYATSTDGRSWSQPAELFPEGVSLPMRLYFFHAANGRMLAFAGLREDRDRTREANKGSLVVREIRPDHTLGSVFTLRPAKSGQRAGDPPPYSTATDAAFIEACRQLLGARVTLETQDYGLLFDPNERSPWHDAAHWPNGKLGTGFWKAASFYHRADGAVVGVGKAGWTAISLDEGKTWSPPVIPPTLLTNNAKIWGQRTGDGRFVLVYNPTPRPRHPLALVHGDDGVLFGDMRAVQTHFPVQRYAGINKNTGLQYVRGIAEWATDGSIPAARDFLWLTYSANKEDIWVARVPLPIGADSVSPVWNVSQPKWATVSAASPSDVIIETQEPSDSADAAQLFPPSSSVAISAQITVPPAGIGALDVELVAGKGGARPVRLRFAGDGFLRGVERDKVIEFGRYNAGTDLTLRLQADCSRGVYRVSVDGKPAEEAQFAEPAPAIERIVFLAWARADADRAPVFLPATADVGPEFDQPAPAFKARVRALKIERK